MIIKMHRKTFHRKIKNIQKEKRARVSMMLEERFTRYVITEKLSLEKKLEELFACESGFYQIDNNLHIYVDGSECIFKHHGLVGTLYCGHRISSLLMEKHSMGFKNSVRIVKRVIGKSVKSKCGIWNKVPKHVLFAVKDREEANLWRNKYFVE